MSCKYTLTDFLEDCRKAITSRVVRIGLMLIAYALLAKFGLPIDQADPLAQAIVASLDYVLLSGITAMIAYRVDARHRIDVGPRAAVRRRRERARTGVESVEVLPSRDEIAAAIERRTL